mmetsp:Transcript_5471/g.13269  ORF Transcript_5471/g.13269 Transcript_5471/m.13269 type:complete len:212 (+) Transcript_5471:1183-1818(+)
MSTSDSAMECGKRKMRMPARSKSSCSSLVIGPHFSTCEPLIASSSRRYRHGVARRYASSQIISVRPCSSIVTVTTAPSFVCVGTSRTTADVAEKHGASHLREAPGRIEPTNWGTKSNSGPGWIPFRLHFRSLSIIDSQSTPCRSAAAAVKAPPRTWPPPPRLAASPLAADCPSIGNAPLDASPLATDCPSAGNAPVDAAAGEAGPAAAAAS